MATARAVSGLRPSPSAARPASSPADAGCERENFAVDFISLLPPELLLQVFIRLSPADVTRCLLVCCVWCSRLSQLEPYWRVACRRVGLSESMTQKLRHLYKTWRTLFLVTQNYLRRLSLPPPTTVSLTDSHPYDIRYSYQYARQGIIVGTVYRDFKPREIVVEAVRDGRWRRTHTLKLAFDCRPENRVVWGHMLKRGVYVCATASGRWGRYNTLSSTSPHSPLPPLFTWLGDTLYDTDLRLGCCEWCGLVTIAKLVSYHNVDDPSFWDLCFFQVSPTHPHARPSRTFRIKLYHKNRDIVGRRVSYGKKKVCLLSKTSLTTCSSHLVLLQWGNRVTGSMFSMKGGAVRLSQTSHVEYVAGCNNIDTGLSVNGGLNTEMTLSADRQLLALVFQAQLHVWDVWSGQTISCVDLPPHVREPFEQLRLLAVGHLLTVVGLEFSTSLLVVVTQTGEVVKRCDRFAQLHSRMISPYTDLLCVSEEAWLNGIATPTTSEHCVVVYWNKTNRSLEAVQIGEGPVINHNSPPTRGKKTWWKLWK